MDNTSEVSGKSSSISERSIIVPSSEPTIQETFNKLCTLIKRGKRKWKGNDEKNHKIYKERIEKALKNSELNELNEQKIQENEHLITEIKEDLQSKEEQINQLNKTIKDLETQLKLAQTTTKPQRAKKGEDGDTSVIETSDSFQSNISKHSTPRERNRELPNALTTFSEAYVNKLSLGEMMINYNIIQKSDSRQKAYMEKKYRIKINNKAQEIEKMNNNLAAKIEQQEKVIKDLKDRNRRAEARKSNKYEAKPTEHKSTQVENIEETNDSNPQINQENIEENNLHNNQEIMEEREKIEVQSIPKYSDLATKKMSLNQIIEIYKSLTRSRRKGDSEEARKYLEQIIIKADEIMKILTQKDEEIIRLHGNLGTLEQVLQDQIQKNKELETIIQNQLQKMKQLHKDNSNTEELEKCKEKLKHLLEKEQKYQDEQEIYKKDINKKNEIIEDFIRQQEDQNSTSYTRLILETLKDIREKIETPTSKTMQPQQYDSDTREEEQNKQTSLYSEVISSPIINSKIIPTLHAQYSRAAILVRRRQNTGMSLNDIRIILTRETKDKVKFRQIHCEPAKDKNTLIIKTFNDKDTEQLMDLIESIESLKDIIEITYKSADIRKLILLGVPNEMDPVELLNNLQNLYESEIPISYVNKKQREGSKTYQLIFEAEAQIAKHLLKQSRIVIGFTACTIASYQPIIRCKNCQLFGHSEKKCRQAAICEHCARPHNSKFCYYRKDDKSNYHRCRNCLGTNGDFPHRSSSSDCPTLQYYLSQRNKNIQINQESSIP